MDELEDEEPPEGNSIDILALIWWIHPVLVGSGVIYCIIEIIRIHLIK